VTQVAGRTRRKQVAGQEIEEAEEVENPSTAEGAPTIIVGTEQTAPTTEEAAAAAGEGEEDSPTVKAKRGKVFVTYRGHAHVATYSDPENGDSYRFEPGVPVEVPKGIAEVLLTHPFEEWTSSDEAPAPPQGEE
jgi:hypothetical protein